MKQASHIFAKRASWRSQFANTIFMLVLLASMPGLATAGIEFEETTQQAGIHHVSPTAGSAWGDLNGDGWPDLWVSNHDYNTPSIYLNLKDGSFAESAQDVIIGKKVADFHGAAWADFDNDGDQDLIVISGGGYGRGFSPNFLFVNDNGKLTNKAKELRVDNPLGRGRAPLWLDADNDGKLDLLAMNRPRTWGKFPSSISLQTPDGFVPKNKMLGFNPSATRSKREKIENLISNVLHFRFRKGPGEIIPAEVFAQLADIDSDGAVDLMAYNSPMRIYATGKVPFDEITNDIEFPSFRSVQDVAVDDFNGDGKMDMFLVRSSSTSDVIHVNPSKIAGVVKKGSAEAPTEVRFRCPGKVTFAIFMPWHDPTDPLKKPPLVYPGRLDPIPAIGQPFTLSPDDASIQEKPTLPDRSIVVDYNPGTQEWRIRMTYFAINFWASSDQPIDQVETSGFSPSKGSTEDVLLVGTDGGLKVDRQAGLSSRPTTCASVAAGDFDNDMDIDLYLVCREPVQNIPNMLYENDGSGHFAEIADAGGAPGSKDGSGNQVSMCDYDRDGFLDLFVTNGEGHQPFSLGPHQLFRNKGNENHWLEIDLEGTRSNRDGIGAIVQLETGGKKQFRVQDGGMHCWSQNCQRIHFGLGSNNKVDKLTIRWPSGAVQELKEIPADQILKVIETAKAK